MKTPHSTNASSISGSAAKAAGSASASQVNASMAAVAISPYIDIQLVQSIKKPILKSSSAVKSANKRKSR